MKKFSQGVTLIGRSNQEVSTSKTREDNLCQGRPRPAAGEAKHSSSKIQSVILNSRPTGSTGYDDHYWQNLCFFSQTEQKVVSAGP